MVVEVETPLHDPLLDEQDRWRTLHSPHVRVIPVMTVSHIIFTLHVSGSWPAS